MKKAFYQWPFAFNKTSFGKSDNGLALYAYLLFKNDLPLAGLEALFLTEPKKIDSSLIRLWQSLLQLNPEIWTKTVLQWSSDWTNVFGSPIEVRILARHFNRKFTLSEIEELLRKTSSGTWERHWIQWRYITTLLMGKEDVKAAKLLKHLKGVSQNNPISGDLMNLTAARMLYQNGYLTESLRYYKKVTKGSDYWFEALEEMGWVELGFDRPQNTLAYTQTLLSPDFKTDVGPETFYLASLASLKICDYLAVLKIIKGFQNRFKVKVKKLLKLKKQPETPAVRRLFQVLAKGRAHRPSLGVFGYNLPRHIIRDEQLYFLMQRQDQLNKESEIAKKIYAQSLIEGVLTINFRTEMKKFKNKIIARGHKNYAVVLNRVKILVDQEILEISKTLKKMQILEAEVTQQLSLVEEIINNKNIKRENKKGTTGAKGKYVMSFIYRGERWVDELSNYRINVNNNCTLKRKL